MAKLTRLVNERCTVDVYKETQPGLLVVSYRPSQFHQDLMLDLEKIGNNPDTTDARKLDANVEWIKTMVCSWNVEADNSTDEKPVFLPVEEKHIKALGLIRQAHIIRAITGDMNLGELSKGVWLTSS